MKKWARIFLALILVATLSLSGVLPASASQFQDVTRSGMGEEIFDSINYVSDNGILVGTTSTNFGPNTTLSRAMIVAVLYRWSGDGGSYSNPFTDVYKSDYYYDAVGWAQQNGIVYGTTATQFSPAKPVTTEQFFAFLYRYALKYHPDKTDYTEASITSHPDYSYVTEYAKPALRWAKQHNILQLTNSSYLWPQSGMARKNVALYITRYSLQVKGFDEEDRFSFTNSTMYFSKKPRISTSLYNKLESQIKSKLGDTAAESVIERIEAIFSEDFAGACFGMSLTTYLDKIGKINFCRNTAGVDTLSQIPYPKNNFSVESAIYYHHCTQAATTGVELVYYGNSIQIGMDILASTVQNHGPILFNFYTNEDKQLVGHSVILLSCKKNAYGYYNLQYVDPNYSEIVDDVFDLELTNNVIYSTTYSSYAITRIGFVSPARMIIWDAYDFDGVYNTQTHTTKTISDSELQTKNLPTETAELYVEAKPFRIKNAEGQILEFNGCDLIGDMEQLDTATIINGADHPCTLIIQVPYSSSFTYDNVKGDAYFGVSTQAYTGCAFGKGIQKIVIDSTRNVQLYGDAMEVYIKGRLIQPNLEYLSVQGSGNQNVTVQYTETGAEVFGLQGKGILSAVHHGTQVTMSEETCVFSSNGISVDAVSNHNDMQIFDDTKR